MHDALTSCGKLNGSCFVYDVQHLESCLVLPFLHDVHHGICGKFNG